MGSRKIIIIAGVVVVIAVAIIGILALTHKKTPTAPAGTSQQPSVSTGTVTQVQPSPTPFGRTGFKVTTDSTAPYAPNLPRSQEPTTTKSVAFSDYNAAVKNGQIPDSNGLYDQVINGDPIAAAYSAGNVNYSLPEQQFLATYYPDYQTVISDQNNAEPDNIAVDNSSSNSTVDASVTTIPTVPSIDPKIFHVIADTSHTAIAAYITNLSQITQAFDIIHNQDLVNNVFVNTTTSAQIASYKAQAKAVQSQIVSLEVPSNILGLAESYFQLYGNYQSFTDDRGALDNVTASNADAVSTKAQNDSDNLNTIESQINTDINIVKNIIGS